MLIHLAGASLPSIIALLILGPLAAFVIKSLHQIDNKVSNPEAKALIVDSEEAFFDGLSSILGTIKGHAVNHGVTVDLVMKGLDALVKAERANPFGAAVPVQAPLPVPAPAPSFTPSPIISPATSPAPSTSTSTSTSSLSAS